MRTAHGFLSGELCTRMSEMQFPELRLNRSLSFRAAILCHRRFCASFNPGVLVCGCVSRPLPGPFQLSAKHV